MISSQRSEPWLQRASPVENFGITDQFLGGWVVSWWSSCLKTNVQIGMIFVARKILNKKICSVYVLVFILKKIYSIVYVMYF